MPGRQSPLWPISAGLICGDLFMIILTWFLVLPAVAVPNNRTIDDTFGDFVTGQKVVYTPSTPLTWKTQDCTDCLLNPEVNNAHNGTYTAATCYPALGSMSINLTFTGVAIYAFFILANNAPSGAATLTKVNFILDDQAPIEVLHSPNASAPDFQYNVMLWSQTNLLPIKHTLLMTTSDPDEDVYVNFDYALYTHDDELLANPPASRSSILQPPAQATTTTSVAVSPKMSSFAIQSPTSPSSFTPEALSPTRTLSVALTLSTMSSAALFPTMLSTTTVTPSPSSLTSESRGNLPGSHQGAIIGGAAGGSFVALALLLAVIYVHQRHRQPQNRLRFKSKPIVSSSQGSTETLGASSPIITPSDGSSSIYQNATTFPEDGGAIAPGELYRATRTVEQGSPALSYTTGTNDSPSAVTSTHLEDVRRARQEELNHQLTERQEVMREVSSGLDGINHMPNLNDRHHHVRQVSVHTLRRLRSYVGRDELQRENNGGSQPAAAEDTNTTGLEDATEVNVAELQELNRLLRLEIEYLKLQQQSSWAQGLSDDPPPGYTPAHRSQHE